LWYRPATGGLYFWDVAASAVVPATGNYTTKITWPDNTPLYELYGYDLGDTILGSGNPGDDLVQFGLHLAVVKQDKNGKWGEIRVWNSPLLVDITKSASQKKAYPGQHVKFVIEIRNTTPVQQTFVLDDPIPAGTTFVKGVRYDAATNSIHWEGKLSGWEKKVIGYIVKVNPDTLPGTIITNTAVVADEALGDTSTITIEVLAR
jgi:uncharacterized repeat protein (TIGR01451 family)